MAKPSDVSIEDVSIDFEEYPYRTPVKFGGLVKDTCVLMNARVQVRTRDGKEAEGCGSMPLANTWAVPARAVSVDRSLEAMRRLGEALAAVARSCDECAHPLDLSHALDPGFLRAAASLSREMDLDTHIPKLCTVDTASSIDAAIHDGFGKANGINSYDGLGPEFVSADLSRYLDTGFAGKYLDGYVARTPQARMHLFHLVGALDPLTPGEIGTRLDDGLPEALTEWIEADGLAHLKVKFNGDDLDWDVQRLIAVDKVAAEMDSIRGAAPWSYSGDFNETCENVDYLLEFLRRVREGRPTAFERLAYIEQPTDRDLVAHPENKMHAAAAIKPIVIDESLTDFETLLLAREQGYSGVAIKACKGQSQALLMYAAAREYGMFIVAQDSTCPGASFLHSVGLAARLPGVTAIEGNARQYCPSASEGWEDRFPGMFRITDGTLDSSGLTGPGLGH